jgi:aminoglycoside 6'-N-acetyltransferase I
MKFMLSEAGYQDASEIAELCALLWPDVSAEEHRAERQAILTSGVCGGLPIAIFIARDESGTMQGFIEVGMRSHADGCARRVLLVISKAGLCGTQYAGKDWERL